MPVPRAASARRRRTALSRRPSCEPQGCAGLEGSSGSRAQRRSCPREAPCSRSGAPESRAFHTSQSSPCDTASPALASALLPPGARFWVCLFRVTRTCISVGRVPSHLLRRPAGWACAGWCLWTQPGPCSPRPPPGVLVKGYLSRGSDGKNSGKVSPCFGEQSSEVVGVVEIQRCHRACM